MGTFDGKVALVTGAGSGIGEATMRLLAARGARVAAVGRTPDELKQCVAEVTSQGGEATAVIADIADPAEMKRGVEQTIEKWGRLDIVFANAGVNGVWAPLDEITPEEWDHTLGINLRGTFLTIQSALPYLKREGGAITITSSVNGTRMFSNSGASAYACSKAGQVALAKMAALELAKHKIRVNVICPGAITTDIDENTDKRHIERARVPVEYPAGNIPLTGGTPGTVEDVAELVAFLSSDAARHITGAQVFIDGAQSLLMG